MQFADNSMVWSLVAIFAVQALAMAGVVVLKGREAVLRRYLPQMVSLAAGVLLGTALLHLLPEAVEQVGNRPRLWLVIAATFLAMFALERIVAALTGTAAEPTASSAADVLHHHHTPHSGRPLNLVFGGFLHSFVDGAGVAAAFAVNTRVGWLTAAAITLHEIPHRLGDFALLLHMKMPAGRALRLTAFEGTSALLGWGAVAALGASSTGGMSYLLPVSGASFLYIASVNLLPELQNEYGLRRVLEQLFFLVAGTGLVAVVTRVPGS